MAGGRRGTDSQDLATILDQPVSSQSCWAEQMRLPQMPQGRLLGWRPNPIGGGWGVTPTGGGWGYSVL